MQYVKKPWINCCVCSPSLPIISIKPFVVLPLLYQIQNKEKQLTNNQVADFFLLLFCKNIEDKFLEVNYMW